MLAKFRFSYMEQGDPVAIEDLGRKMGADGEEVASGDYKAHMELCIQGLLKEARDRFKGWMTISSSPIEHFAVAVLYLRPAATSLGPFVFHTRSGCFYTFNLDVSANASIRASVLFQR